MASKRAHRFLNNREKKERTRGPTSSHLGVEGTPSASLLNNAKNTHIMGGSFLLTTTNTTNVKTTTYDRSLSILHKRVAPHAILNAGGRADEVKCHPGTRKEVIGRIEKWRIEAQSGIAPPIFWLSGPAGAGKSAIVQTVAERWKKDAVPQANFFFFRSDPSRNSLPPLIATLVHQITLLYPLVRDSVETILSKNPLILDCDIEEQLVELIINPLRALQESSSSYCPPVLLIDGLDECDDNITDDQRRILHAFDKVLAECPGFICLLLASRDYSQIQATFNRLSTALLPLYLNDEYSPESDIRTYVNDEFKSIKRTHPLAKTLGENWPSVENVEDIVEKSTGHFIYAATVMRSIAHSSASPIVSLARVQDVTTQIPTKSPFSRLDAVYDHVLSQVTDQEALKDILHTVFLIESARISKKSNKKRRVPPANDPLAFQLPSLPFTTQWATGVTPMPLLAAYNPRYTEAVLHSCLADLTPIARYTDGQQLLFHHASFEDYLLDQSRSRKNFIDLPAFGFKILPTVWKCARDDDQMYVVAFDGLSRLKQLPPNFLDVLVTLNLRTFSRMEMHWERALETMYNLCTCDDDLIKYGQVIREWVKISPFSVHRELGDGSLAVCIRRYFMILCLEGDDLNWKPPAYVMAKLSPATDRDVREITLWLKDLLQRLYMKVDGTHNQRHHEPIIERCISYALTIKIPLDDLKLEIDRRSDQEQYYESILKKCRPYNLTTSNPTDVLKPDRPPNARRYRWVRKIVQRITSMACHKGE